MEIKMTSRKRVEAALKHIEPDRTPVFEYVLLSPIASFFLGRRFEDYAGDMTGWLSMVKEMEWENAVRQYAIDRVELAKMLGHDLLYVVPCPGPLASSQKDNPCALLYMEEGEMEEGEDDPVELIIKRNNLLEQTPLNISDENYTVYSFIKEELQKRELDIPILAPAYVHGVWTDVDLMQTMIIEPDIAHKHFTLATNRALKYIKKYISLDLDQIGIGGDFAGNRLLISPQCYREFIVPEVRTLSQYIHKAGKWSVNASDGNLWEVMGDFLEGCEVDAYLEIDMNAGMDMKRLKAEYGDRFTLYGNMDCGNMLTYSTPEDIRRFTVECIEAGMGNGGHILCASNAITGSIPFKNYLAMVEGYRDYFLLPKIKY